MYRAGKSGLAREAQEKVAEKWSDQAALTALQWVSCSVGIPLPDGYNGGIQETQQFLMDGYVLIRLAEWILPGKVKPKLLEKRATLAFKQMELIGVFLELVKSHNLAKETELFQTVDLYESVNMPAVLTTLESVGRSLQKEGRGFGKQESHGDKREWTEEQQQAGKSCISLQMGTNKFANQSGMTMGKMRSIMD